MDKILLNGDALAKMYKTFSAKHKERFEYILDPLQVFFQLALLSQCPQGTKLCIQQNILYPQIPSVAQPIVRWLQSDGRRDLLYLFNVFRRFKTFYKDIIPETLYTSLIIKANEGIDQIMATYGSGDDITLIHALQMYKCNIDVLHKEMDEETRSIEQVVGWGGDNKVVNMHDSPDSFTTCTDSDERSSLVGKSSIREIGDDESQLATMETVLINIRSVYTNSHFTIFEEILNLIDSQQITYHDALRAYDAVFSTIHEKIRKWLNEHITL